jgi:hypothetical protein
LKDGKEVLTVPLLAFGWVLWLKKKISFQIWGHLLLEGILEGLRG